MRKSSFLQYVGASVLAAVGLSDCSGQDDASDVYIYQTNCRRVISFHNQSVLQQSIHSRHGFRKNFSYGLLGIQQESALKIGEDAQSKRWCFARVFFCRSLARNIYMFFQAWIFFMPLAVADTLARIFQPIVPESRLDIVQCVGVVMVSFPCLFLHYFLLIMHAHQNGLPAFLTLYRPIFWATVLVTALCHWKKPAIAHLITSSIEDPVSNAIILCVVAIMSFLLAGSCQVLLDLIFIITRAWMMAASLRGVLDLQANMRSLLQSLTGFALGYVSRHGFDAVLESLEVNAGLVVHHVRQFEGMQCTMPFWMLAFETGAVIVTIIHPLLLHQEWWRSSRSLFSCVIRQMRRGLLQWRVPPRRPELDEVCAICADDLRQGELAFCRWGCGRPVHADCMKSWLNYSRVCVFCREVW